MAETQTANLIDIALPAAGQEATYLVVPGESLKFDFDTANAIFAQNGNDLIIEMEGQGIIILDNYMDVASGDNPPIIIQADGAEVPGNVFLASIQPDLQPAAGAEAPSGGTGEYQDDPSSLFDPLNHLGGQADPGRPSPEPFVDPVRGVEEDDGGGGDTPNPVQVQVVLNPGFENSDGYGGGNQETTTTPSALWDTDTGGTELWAGGRVTPDEGALSTGLQSSGTGTGYALSQDISTKADGTLTVSFDFLPRPIDGVIDPNINTFEVTLNGNVVGTMTFNTTTLAYEFILTGETEPIASVTAYEEHHGHLYSLSGLEWINITFDVDTDTDYSSLGFQPIGGDLSAWTDGAIIDHVTAFHAFDTETYDTSDGHTLYGTTGDDFIMGTDRGYIDADSLGTQTDGGDTIHGGEGNDAIYGGNGNDTFYGDAGNDFLHGGAGDDTLYGGTGDDYLRGSTGNDIMDGGAGNDTFDAGAGDTVILGAGDDVVKLFHASLEPIADNGELTINDYRNDGDNDEIQLQQGLTVTGITDGAGGWADVTVSDGAGEQVIVHLLGVTQADLSLAAAAAPADTTDDVLQYVIAHSAP